MKSSLPRLITSRLVLRPFVMADAWDVQRMAGDREVAAGAMHIPHPFRIETATAWIAGHEEQYKRKQSLILAIEAREAALVGAVGFYINAEYQNAEIGYWLGKEHWRKGYASEAVGEMLHYGFQVMRLHKIYANHFESNVASGRILEKHGMKIEGLLKQQVLHYGKYENLVCRGMLREEYLRMHP